MLRKEILKFLIVGVFSTALNYAVFWALLNNVSAPYLVSSALGFLAGVGGGYLFNKKWTFQVKEDGTNHLFLYFSVYSVSLLISLAVLWLQVELLAIPSELANFFCICVTTCTNFIGTKFIVFRTPHAQEL